MSRLGVAVLDFGSSKITVLVGDANSANSLKIKAKGMSDYAGYMDGEFLEPSSLRNSIFLALSDAEKQLNKRIKRIYVGVPAEFCYNENVDYNMFFPKKTTIKKNHIKKLFSINKGKVLSQTHMVISATPISYRLDDGATVQDPINCVVQNLSASISAILVEKQFVNIVGNALLDMGINNFEFVSSSLVEGLYLLNEQERKHGAVLIDCGFISTSVSLIKGEGLVELKSFSLGGGHIASDISELLKVPFSSAEQLKRKLIVTLNTTAKDYYEVVVNNKLTKFSAKTVNEIALARIDVIAEAILKSFQDFIVSIPADSSIYLTGGGLSYIKGIRDYLSKHLKFDIKIIAPTHLQFNYPDLSSELALLEIALKMDNM